LITGTHILLGDRWSAEFLGLTVPTVAMRKGEQF